MVVVEPGQDGSAAGVEHALPGPGNQAVAHLVDLLADPLTGLEATLAVAESLGRGGGELIHASMAGVAAGYAALPTVAPATEHPAPPPQAPPPSGQAAGLGADNDAVRRLVSERRCLSC